ncbi:unnamed protein product [Toxocara canis]|uniref:BTB domain-containing protein n=1 Tax=Toxocara canis TaxID=6265 RepID=A0A183UXL4_TOXCA|nr:unnamed protein product [Toxocara canis]
MKWLVDGMADYIVEGALKQNFCYVFSRFWHNFFIDDFLRLQQPKSISYATAETNARMTRQLAPLNSKTSEMIMTQTFSAFDDDADNGVLCRVCDCWLPGQREFERHCDELHPVAADPDSTTVANSHDSSVTPPSAFLLSSPNSDIGSHSSAPYSPAGTRKRTLAYDTNDDLGSQCAKSGKHLCQACGKFYSSEWNLERHKRESCPLRAKRSKIGDDKGSSRLTRLDSLDLTPLQPVDPKWVDDCALVVGDSRIGVSRSVLSRSSAYFASLFQYYDSHSDVPLPVPVDPVVFQQAVEVFKGTLPLDGSFITFNHP